MKAYAGDAFGSRLTAVIRQCRHGRSTGRLYMHQARGRPKSLRRHAQEAARSTCRTKEIGSNRRCACAEGPRVTPKDDGRGKFRPDRGLSFYRGRPLGLCVLGDR